MKCVYSDQVSLTKDECEKFEKGITTVYEAIKSIVEAVSDFWNNLVKHPFFQELRKLFLNKVSKPITQLSPKKWVQPKYQMPPVLKLDRRSRMHVIRNNC